MLSKYKSSFDRRKQRVRNAIRRNAGGRVRLSVFRSGKNLYAQIIDDSKGVTVAASSTLEEGLKKKAKNGCSVEAAKLVGGDIAAKAKKAGITEVVFDRGGYLFHGRIKALADAAREGGLSF